MHRSRCGTGQRVALVMSASPAPSYASEMDAEEDGARPSVESAGPSRSRRLASLRKTKQRSTFTAEEKISRSEQNKLQKKIARCGISLQKK